MMRAAALALAVMLPAAGAREPVAAGGGHSDQIAWQQFSTAVAPAPQGRIRFETWASDEDTYTASPAWPGAGQRDARKSGQGALQRMALGGAHPGADCGPVANAHAGNFPARVLGPDRQPCYVQEVRRNLSAFRYIVRNGLHTTDGLAQAYRKAQAGWRVALPEDAVAVKAAWVPVDILVAWLARNGVHMNARQVRAQYYISEAQGVALALVALHISSKDLPNWVWATFEHRLNPGRCDTIGCNDSFGAAQARVAPHAAGQNGQYGACAKNPALQRLFESKGLAQVWNNYCLNASEIAFAARDGRPLTIGNAFSERVAAAVPPRHSSCIGCHAGAGINRDGSAYVKQLGVHSAGKVSLPADVVGNDFTWGILAIGAAADK